MIGSQDLMSVFPRHLASRSPVYGACLWALLRGRMDSSKKNLKNFLTSTSITRISPPCRLGQRRLEAAMMTNEKKKVIEKWAMNRRDSSKHQVSKFNDLAL